MMSFDQSFDTGRYEIEAAPEKMKETAVKMKGICCDLKDHIRTAHMRILSSKDIWDAPSYDLLKEIYQEESSGYDSFEKRVMETVNNLEQLIELYQSVEDKAVQDSTALPDSVLQ